MFFKQYMTIPDITQDNIKAYSDLHWQVKQGMILDSNLYKESEAVNFPVN